jgi:dihydroorotate dehydrogenase electron transfer subunit
MENSKKKVRVLIVSMEQIEEAIFDMVIEEKELAQNAKAGQFLSLYLDDESRLLPRPISICGIDKEKGQIRMVFRIAGEGTKQISAKKAGDTIEVLGPLGNGFFDTEDNISMVIGGGIGIPPMLQLAKELNCEKTAVLGYRDELFLLEDFNEVCTTYIATEDGSAGTKGNVIDAIKANALEADVIYACGPTPMLRAIKNYAEEKGIECYISLEERMACGIGACLACTCKSKEKDHHTNVNNKRICKDGPVFLSTEVEI